MAHQLLPGFLDMQTLREFWHQKMPITLCAKATDAIDACASFVNECIENEKSVYGINTGFGALAHQRISKNDLALLQKKLVLSHACGVGEPLDTNCVALMLLLKINCLAQGYSGVSLAPIERLIFLINHEIWPIVPAKGSVGASGDLAPLAHLVLPLIGEGEVMTNTYRVSGHDFLINHQLHPYELKPKEGLALLNGLQATTAIVLDAFFKIERLLEAAIITGAMTLDSVNGNLSAFDEKIQGVRRIQGQIDIAQIYRTLLSDSEFQLHPPQNKKIQDPYCLRCQPQILGAILELIKNAYRHLCNEINAVTDNPLIFVGEGEVISGGNFHGEMLAFTADTLALAISEIGSLSERRIALMLDNHMSGLPAFLIEDAGLNSGLMIAQVTAAACASENKALSHPRSVDTIPTSANQEDHVSMATNAALRLSTMIDNAANILAIELLSSCQALDLHGEIETSSRLKTVKDKVRQTVLMIKEDRLLAHDILKLKTMILAGEINLLALGLKPIDVYYDPELILSQADHEKS